MSDGSAVVAGRRNPPTAPSAQDEPLLHVRDLAVSYARSVQALKGVSLSVPDGCVVSVLGVNGAGKSTLMRAISGTLALHGGAVQRGSIRFGEQELLKLTAADVARAGVVQVPEGRRVFAELTVEENLRAGGLAARSGAARREARARVLDLFPILAQRRSQRAGLLSGGEQQMLAIGRALMAGPRLLLLDEPSLGLAPMLVDQIGAVIAEINRQGTSVVLIEQNAAMALRVADLAYVLEVGEVSLAGRADELANSEEVRKRYLGIGADRSGTSAVDVARRETGGSVVPKELTVDRLTVRFAGIRALTDVSFTVAPGTTHALIGPNGAGKSTCINVLSGVYRATEGTIRYGGVDITLLPAHRVARLGISRTFQNIALSPQATVRDNLLMARHRLTRAGFLSAGLRLVGARREHRAQVAHVREVADLLGLTHLLDHPVRVLPYGDRKRVELARALCAEPEVLLLDEPVAGMTRAESDSMARAITTVRRELGLSILVVEHDMAFVMGMADRLTVLDFGRLIADGTPQQVQDDPEVHRAYLGERAQEERHG